MKFLTTLLALMCIAFSITAQQISRSLLTTAGDFSKNENGISLNWSMGDVFSHTTLGDHHHITEGFQQGDIETQNNIDSSSYRIGDPGIIPQENIDIQVSTFPNPTSDYLVLHFKKSTPQPQTLVAYVFDEKGNFIFHKKLEVEDDKEITLSQIQDLSAGKYFVEFVKRGKTIFTKPFIKINL